MDLNWRKPKNKIYLCGEKKRNNHKKRLALWSRNLASEIIGRSKKYNH